MNAKENFNIPNLITMLRLAGTVFMIFTVPFTSLFLLVYCLTGLTDILDGFIARVTHTTTELGAKLDSIADLLFYSIMGIKIFPKLLEVLPLNLWIYTIITIIVRVSAYLVAAFRYHRFASIHTYFNKVTGLGVFLIPIMLMTPFDIPYCYAACTLAFLSSLEELLIHIIERDYSNKTKTLISCLRRRFSEEKKA